MVLVKLFLNLETPSERIKIIQPGFAERATTHIAIKRDIPKGSNLDLLQPLCKKLRPRAALKLVQDADHSFHVPARTGRKDAQVREELLDMMPGWMAGFVKRKRAK